MCVCDCDQVLFSLLTQDRIDSIVAQSNKLVRAKYFVTKEKIGDCDVEGKSLKYVLKLKVG